MQGELLIVNLEFLIVEVEPPPHCFLKTLSLLIFFVLTFKKNIIN